MMERILTYKDVAELAGVSVAKVRSDREAEHIFCIPEMLPNVRFTYEEAKEYADWVAANGHLSMDFDLTQPYKFLPTGVRVPKIFGNPKKYSGGITLAISKQGDFINCGRMTKIKPYKTGNGHFQIALNNGLQPMAHDLVNLVWNENGRYAPIVHHSNGIKTDNRACNLISLFEDEHKQAHRLMNAIESATTREEKVAARKVYRDFIKEMRKANKELHKEDLRVIDDLDDPETMYMFVTEKSWQKYLETKNEYDLEIRGQYFAGNEKMGGEQS